MLSNKPISQSAPDKTHPHAPSYTPVGGDLDSVQFLAALAEASASFKVVAATDIYDNNRVKLFSKGHELNVDLQERLAQRKLLKPLVASLAVKGGVSADVLEQEVVRQCQSSTFLWAIVGTNFDRLRALYHSAPLHPFVLLWLSVQRVTRPHLFSHCVLASILAGMLVLKKSESLVDAHRALIAGLLHDCGEPYENPKLARLGPTVSSDQWLEMIAHAEIGSLLIDQLADYSESISEAVRQHHEKLDGSGYPCGLRDPQLSPLGSVLSLVETVCGVMNTPDNHAARARLALSFVAGEYDQQDVSLLLPPVSSMFSTGIVLPANFDLTKAIARSEVMSRRLNWSHQAIAELRPEVQNEQMTAVIEFAQRRIARLRSSWEATGIGEYFADEAARLSQSDGNEELFFDLDLVPAELTWRMRSLARTIVLMLHQRCLSSNGSLQSVIAALEAES